MMLERWHELSQRLERLARRRPALYRLRVLLVASLGYAAIGGAILVTAAGAVVAGFLAFEARAVLPAVVALSLTALAVTMAHTLWSALPAPQPNGLPLEAGVAPRLDELIAEVRVALRAPKLSAVLLDYDANAGVIQQPRLLGLAGMRSTLLIGLPLLQALTVGELRAVLAHEFGHVCGRHGRFTSWVIRQRLTWGRLITQLQAGRHRKMTFALSLFFGWYSPYLHAHTDALERAREFEADRVASSVVGRATMERTLLKITIVSAFITRTFHPALDRRALTEAEPPIGAQTELAEALSRPEGPPEAGAWLQAALLDRGDPFASHPPLAERLAALADLPDGGPVRPGDERPSLELLGSEREVLTRRVDAAWRKSVAAGWHYRHRELREVSSVHERLTERTERGPLPTADMRTLVRTTEILRGPAEAKPVLAQLLQAEPRDVFGHFTLGRILLDEGDVGGLEHLHRAMADPAAEPAACELAYDFLLRRGRADEAAQYRRRAQRRLRVLADVV